MPQVSPGVSVGECECGISRICLRKPWLALAKLPVIRITVGPSLEGRVTRSEFPVFFTLSGDNLEINLKTLNF